MNAIKCVLRQLLVILLFTGAVHASKPVLLMGNGYGVYERQRWVNNILIPQGISYVTSATWVDPTLWPNYSAVVIADEPPQIFDVSTNPTGTAAFDTAIRSYLDNGGVVVFVESALPRMLNLPSYIGNVPSWAADWVGADIINRLTNASGYNTVYNESQNVFPWPATMAPQLQSPNWGPLFYTLRNQKTTARSLVTATGGHSLFTVNHYGKGKVVHIGRMLFRIAALAAPASVTNLEKAVTKMVATISKPITKSPILMLGSNYGTYDRNIWANDILVERQIDFVNSSTWVDPTDWPEYSAVLINDTSPKQFDMTANPEEATQFDSRIRQYLSNGGTVIFAEQGLSSLLSMSTGIGTIPTWASPWVGATTIARGGSITGYGANYTISDDVHPWPAEMAPDLASPQWGAYFYALKNLDPVTAKGVIKDASNNNIVAVNRYGDGNLLFLGRTLFRVSGLAAPADPEPYRLAIEKSLVNIDVIRTETLPLASLRTQHGTTRNYLTWQRDPEADTPSYSYATKAYHPRFSPLAPRTLEKITTLFIDLGAEEFYSKSFNIFSYQNLSSMAITVQAATGHSLPPAGAVTVARQVVLAPAGPTGVQDLHQEKFWVKALGASETFPTGAGQNEIIWIQVDSSKWSVGTHTFNLVLNDGNQAQTLPVTVKIHPVTVSASHEPRIGLYGSYFLNTTFAEQTLTTSGTLTSVSYNASTAAPFLRAMREMGNRAGYGSALDLYAIKIQSTGETLNAFAGRRRTNPSLNLLQSGTIPTLDFSGYDAKIAALQAQGVTRISYRSGGITSSTTRPTNYNDIIEKLTGHQFTLNHPTPTPLSNEWKAACTGIWGQFADYLRSKGFTELTYKYSDELNAEETEDLWLPVCTVIADAGWAPEANLSTYTVNATTLNLIKDISGVFQFNENFMDKFLDLEATAAVTLPSNAIVTTYGSWGYYKSPSNYTRREWWELFNKGLNVGIEVYTMDRLQVFDGTTVFLSASAEGWRNGWKEGAYLQKLSERYNATESSTNPAVIAWRSNVGNFFSNMVAPETGSAPSSAYYHGMRWSTVPASGSIPVRKQLDANSDQLDQGRRDLLELLATEP